MVIVCSCGCQSSLLHPKLLQHYLALVKRGLVHTAVISLGHILMVAIRNRSMLKCHPVGSSRRKRDILIEALEKKH